MRLARRLLFLAVVLAVGSAGWLMSPSSDGDRGRAAGQSERTASEAFDARLSDVWIEDEGTVVALLRDDLEGSRHQRFLLRLEDGATLLVSHNIDLAPRVPVEKGDLVQVRGEFVWNEKGGLVHWTHHDPRGQRTGGWIRHEGNDYR